MPIHQQRPWQSKNVRAVLAVWAVAMLFLYSQSNLKYWRTSGAPPSMRPTLFAPEEPPADYGAFRLHPPDHRPSSELCSAPKLDSDEPRKEVSNPLPVKVTLLEQSIFINPFDAQDRKPECAIWSNSNRSLFSMFSAVTGWRRLLQGKGDKVPHFQKLTASIEKLSVRQDDVLAYTTPERWVQHALCVAEYESSGAIGSSTGCLVFYDHSSNILHYGCIGDSGIVVIREYGDEFADIETYNDPETPPKQLGVHGDGVDAFRFGNVTLVAGDVVLVANRPLFENLSLSEIVTVISLHHWFQNTAVTLSHVQQLVSLSMSTSRTPFSKKLQAKGYVRPGGLLEDIAVLLLWFDH